MAVQSILTIFRDHLETVVKEICDEHDLDFESVRKKYIDSPVENTKKPKSSKKSSKSTKKVTEVVELGDGDAGPSSGRSATRKKAKSELIETIEYVHDGTTYLVDKKKNVYSYDVDNPKLIGIKLVDGSIKFFAEDDYE